MVETDTRIGDVLELRARQKLSTLSKSITGQTELPRRHGIARRFRTDVMIRDHSSSNLLTLELRSAPRVDPIWGGPVRTLLPVFRAEPRMSRLIAKLTPSRQA
jgi:hypothetical protein